MATLRPFRAFRPKPEFAAEVAAKPYDVLNSDEARVEVQGHPLSFLHVGKPEVDLDPTLDIHDPRVYATGRDNLQKLIADGVLVEDPAPSLYLYAQTMGEHTQYGLVGCAAVEEYWNDTIKKHEHTRKDKEEDRCNHVRVTNAHTGPIFLTYPDHVEVDAIVDRVRATPPLTDHVAPDGIRHQTWVIDDPATITALQGLFTAIPNLYVADGHHRSAAAAIVGRERGQANPSHTGEEEYNFFLAVFFPAGQLRIMDYNRVVKDLHGLDEAAFMAKLGAHFTITPATGQVRPPRKGSFGMYLGGTWYQLEVESALNNNPDPVQRLDVAIMQNHILRPILGIDDPRTDKRIDFVGGIRGLGELERRVNSGEMAVAFSMHPTSIHELMAIADAGQVMPPKSTWFEPKLRDGLFVHFLD
ncbi:MAG: DUF1015 family protein [Bacteroidota bacterium]|jgi:uncharacterized protein (DUF1015 family)|nr:DUF1015 family protein [Bacteroidota bacterium]